MFNPPPAHGIPDSPVAARRIALQMIHNTIVCAPDGLRETLRRMTRMQLVRTLAAWRPDLSAYRCGFRRKPATHSDAKPANVPI